MEDELIKFPELTQVLTDYATYIREQYKSNLVSNGHKVTGKLYSSVQTNVVIGETQFAVDMSLAHYYKWVEDGRPKGGRPPINKILEWIQIKPVLPTGEKYENLPTEKAQLSLAFAIAKSIEDHGYYNMNGLPVEPSHDLALATEQTNANFMNRIEEALTNDLGRMGSKLISLVIGDNNVDPVL